MSSNTSAEVWSFDAVQRPDGLGAYLQRRLTVIRRVTVRRLPARSVTVARELEWRSARGASSRRCACLRERSTRRSATRGPGRSAPARAAPRRRLPMRCADRPARRPLTAKGFALETRMRERAAGADAPGRGGQRDQRAGAEGRRRRRRRRGGRRRARGHGCLRDDRDRPGREVADHAREAHDVAGGARPARSRPRSAVCPPRTAGTSDRPPARRPGGQRRAAVGEPGEQCVARGLVEPAEPDRRSVSSTRRVERRDPELERVRARPGRRRPSGGSAAGSMRVIVNGDRAR